MSTRAVPFGKYHLLERINVGGMAEVYRAKMIGVEGFEKQLAIKRILPAISSDKDFINMFIDEAKISVQLNHANIAQTFELGRINDTYFIALEYVPGRDLRAVFERMRRRGETVPAELACYAVSRFCEGLDYAHRKKDVAGRDLGIIHRDISPQNILVSYEGEVKIIDFGIAKAANKIMKTQAGILKGKFGYMSPEQVRGLPLDRRSDIFAAGIVLYELLVGDRLFTGESDYSILEKVRAANVPRPSTIRKGVPAPLERIVAKALAKEPDDRYQHASELVADLQRYLLAQEHLFTREDLAAFMKTVFAEEFEREKRLAQESFGLGEETPTAPRPDFGDASVVPQIRPSMRDARPRLEGGAARPVSPPPPPADAFMNTDPGERPQKLSAPKGRLQQARQSAETDKVDTSQGLDAYDEETATETDPLAARGRAPSPNDDLTPTPEDFHFRRGSVPNEEVLVTDLPTRIGRAAGPLPPPVPSGPPRPRGAQTSLPPKNVRMPARITDSLPEPMKRAPPPIALADDEDEPTVMEDGASHRPRRLNEALRGGPDTTPEGSRPPPARTPPKAAPKLARPPPPPSIVIDDEETTNVGPKAQPYAPRRRQSWAIVPVAVALALAVAWVVVKLGTQKRAPGDEPAPAPTMPLVSAPSYGGLVVKTDPADAVLYIDDRIVKSDGNKPFSTERLEADLPHVLRAVKDGFKEVATTVTVARGETKELTLKLKSRSATLTVRTNPPGAVLFVDDREVARTPEKLGTLEPGKHSIRVDLKCYASVSRTVDLSEGDQVVDLTLPPIPGACPPAPVRAASSEPGLLRLMSRPPARVWLDGIDTGKDTPLVDQPIAPGKHTLRLTVGQKEREEEIEIKPGERLVKVVVLP